jgi:starvation-inducible DNA-binding protein
MKNNQIVKALELLLSSSYAIMLKTQNYHWNVVGSNFKALHDLFGEQYEELFEAIDEIAERIRAIGSKVEASFDFFTKNITAKNANKNFSSVEMINDLVDDHKKVIKILSDAIKTAQKNSDEVTADLFIERIQYHEKTLWMLNSSL